MDNKYNAAYINALSEEKDPKLLFEWICKLHRENVDLREKVIGQEAAVRQIHYIV